MPIAFKTESHNHIPVGFFNIETDLFLINKYFVFASDFCNWIYDWAGAIDDIKTGREIYVIENNKMVGNLMGAIAGIDRSGFIGEVYELYPFPENKENFKQNPEGFKTRDTIEKIIQKYMNKLNIAPERK